MTWKPAISQNIYTILNNITDSVIIITSYVLWKDVQEQRAHTQEEEDWPESQSQTQREVQTCPDSSQGSGKCHRIHLFNSLSFVKHYPERTLITDYLCQVREVRREETRYSGEWSGIRAGVKRSVKFKWSVYRWYSSKLECDIKMDFSVFFFLFFLYSLSQISKDGNYLFYATAHIMNEIKSQVQNFCKMFFGDACSAFQNCCHIQRMH